MKTGNAKNFSMLGRIRSMGYAWQGILSFFKKEQNAIIHLVATIIVALLAVFFRISLQEIAVLVLVTGFVWAAELLNSSIEMIMDFLTDKKLPAVKIIKDLAAAAVLVAVMTALLVGAFIFTPKIISLWQH